MGVSYTFQFRDVFAAWHFLAEGLALTLFLSLATMVFGMAVGVAGAAARLYGGRLLRIVVGGYVEAIRHTPLLVQLFIVFFGLPSLGLRLEAMPAAVLSLTAHPGPYENVRAACEDRGRS